MFNLSLQLVNWKKFVSCSFRYNKPTQNAVLTPSPLPYRLYLIWKEGIITPIPLLSGDLTLR